jgi:hypothetical protein
MSNIIIKSVDTLGTAIAGGIAGVATWPVMSGKLGYDPANSFLNTVMLTYTLTKHYWSGLDQPIKPSVVVAGVPLPTVEEVSHGISDREVRYRANGGVFLAHQSGGNESLRIVGRAWGQSRFWFLNLLDLLFLWGSTKTIDVFQNAFAGTVPFLTLNQTGNWMNRAFETSVDAWSEFNDSNLNEGYQEQHLTFPVVTKNRVYLAMYIETYSWRQRLDKDGRKMVEYTIFFRKYEPPPEYEFAKIRVPKQRPAGTYKYIKVYKEKTVNKPFIYAMWKAITEISATISINLDLFNFSNIYDFGQQLMLNYFGINKKEGRIPGIIEQRGFF